MHDIGEVGAARIKELLDTTATPYVNTHLAPHAKDFDMEFTSTDERYIEPLVESMMQDIQAMIDHFGRERVILENANYDPNYQVPTLVIQPRFVKFTVRYDF
jgi:uncharacterized protein (UPF0276 family)